MNNEDVKRKVEELVPVNELDLLKEDDISITTIEEPESEKKTTDDRQSMSVFNSESDEEIKISVKITRPCHFDYWDKLDYHLDEPFQPCQHSQFPQREKISDSEK